ncbi:sugar transferase [Cohnella laeviribosi]|jgi:O-antigen biosynthesis protein WbqP|uniref:sugar transferase n=1 Tax=Cohnella laeviribosi TaxID=380174 RepID=UPI000374A49C|nr:sugar transferase [Cohnella laeviribosi]
MISYIKVKRVLDFVLSLFLLILTSPLLLILALLIKVDSNGPVLFKQKRVGKEKKEFNILKFRTMYIDAPKDTPTDMLVNPELYITRVGRFLRKTSLDELPQLVNILRGEMSFVGPRPALWNQFDLINKRDQYNVNSINPGLTGWAQINGRDEISIDLKVQYDSEYYNNLSLKFDLKILLKTVLAVAKSEGIKEGADKIYENTHNW